MGHVDVVRLLLDNGADINATEQEALTAFITPRIDAWSI